MYYNKIELCPQLKHYSRLSTVVITIARAYVIAYQERVLFFETTPMAGTPLSISRVPWI